MTEVVLVDEKDQELGTMEKMKAHREGRLHRAFSIMLYRNTSEGLEVLLQQRAFEKYHAAGMWANTCCSHPFQGENLLEAAYRRLQEEVFPNIDQTLLRSEIQLLPLGSFIYRAELDKGMIEHELDHVFYGEYPEEVREFNRDEIAQMKWAPLKELLKKIEKTSEAFSKNLRYAPWLKPVCLKVYEAKKA